jgi:hypothetical protein
MLRTALCVLLLLGVSLVHVNAQAGFAVDCKSANAVWGRVELPPTTALDSQMTIHVDINMRSGWGNSWIFYASGSPAVGLFLRRDGGSASMRFQVGSTNVDSTWFPLSAETWYSLVVRVDTSAANKVEFFVNGVARGSSAAALSVPSGTRNINLCHGFDFNGLIDNFAVWRNARTMAQIDANVWPKTIPMQVRFIQEIFSLKLCLVHHTRLTC